MRERLEHAGARKLSGRAQPGETFVQQRHGFHVADVQEIELATPIYPPDREIRVTRTRKRWASQ